jgi:hypothetical protein
MAMIINTAPHIVSNLVFKADIGIPVFASK